MLDPSQTVATVVLDHSECAPVLQRHRIDYCCHGHVSIQDACAAAGLDADALLAELAGAIAARGGQDRADPRALSTAALIDHIAEKHHAYLRRALPFLLGLSAKVSRVHGDRDPRLRGLEAVVRALADALLPHLDEEEQRLFPALVAQTLDRPAARDALARMLDEHRAVGALLARLRALSADFTVPDWACTSYRTLFKELAALEADTLTHVHLENHVLAPRFG